MPSPRDSAIRTAALSMGVVAAAAGIVLTAAFPGQQEPSSTAAAPAGPAVTAPVTAAAAAGVDFSRESLLATGSTANARTTVLSSDTESFAAPLKNPAIASSFGYRVNPLGGLGDELHTGTDYAGACGTPVLASRSGSVVESGWHAYGGGQRIVVDHGGGLQTSYNHLSALGVSVGETVDQGQNLGSVGTTGNSTGCHLHFELLVNGEKVDPESRLQPL